MKKILFTTAVEHSDYYVVMARKNFFEHEHNFPAYGLRFLKENIPEIEILEHPDWNEFKEKLKGVDILGISFYMRDVEVVKKMIEYARPMVKEIWGGNYGVLCDEIKPLFDRVFIGYAENDISEILDGRELKEIMHPIIIDEFKLSYIPLEFRVGILFTTRGCNYGCSFCQASRFVPKRSVISIPEIRRVLEKYKELGIKRINIADENFLSNKKHAEEVVDILHEHRFAFGCVTRADLILMNDVEKLSSKGLVSCSMGIESLRQENLDYVNKKEKVEDILEAIKELRNNDVSAKGPLIIGFPDDTEKTIKEDIEKFSSLGTQQPVFPILTPFPHTPLWDDINSRYGIFEKDYSKFDDFNLVWNHPTISPEKMREIFVESHNRFYTNWNRLKALFEHARTMRKKSCYPSLRW